MPIKKTRNKKWWEDWDPTRRGHSDQRLVQIASSLNPHDAVRLADLIYSGYVAQPRHSAKELRKLRPKGRGPEKLISLGPHPSVREASAKLLREMYTDLIESKDLPKDEEASIAFLADMTDEKIDRVRKMTRSALSGRRRKETRARGIVVLLPEILTAFRFEIGG